MGETVCEETGEVAEERSAKASNIYEDSGNGTLDSFQSKKMGISASAVLP